MFRSGRTSEKYVLVVVMLCVGGRALACPSTCYDATCDDWAATKTCSDLEEWDCDCTGCECVNDGSGSDNQAEDDKGLSNDKNGNDEDDKGSWAPAPTVAVTGTWTSESLEYDGVDRVYRTYVPVTSGNPTGLMVFLHGYGGSNEVRNDYGVAAAADEFGFVGVVPNGSPITDGAEGSYAWNIDDSTGTDEVGFVHAIVSTQRSALPALAAAPTIILGFSNGAGLAALLGCHDSSGLWVAHVGVHYDEASDYPSTCVSASSSSVEWSAVGEDDYFLESLTPTPVDGLLAQYEALRDELGCVAEIATQTDGDGFWCLQYPSCSALGQLCVYSNTGHVIRNSMAPLAWCYLTGAPCDYLQSASASAGMPAALAFAFAATVLLMAVL